MWAHFGYRRPQRHLWCRAKHIPLWLPGPRGLDYRSWLWNFVGFGITAAANSGPQTLAPKFTCKLKDGQYSSEEPLSSYVLIWRSAVPEFETSRGLGYTIRCPYYRDIGPGAMRGHALELRGSRSCTFVDRLKWYSFRFCGKTPWCCGVPEGPWYSPHTSI